MRVCTNYKAHAEDCPKTRFEDRLDSLHAVESSGFTILVLTVHWYWLVFTLKIRKKTLSVLEPFYFQEKKC